LPLLQLQKQILQKLFATLQKLQNDLQMQADEMLCTLHLLLLDSETRTCETITIGDGLVVWNGNIQEYEQNNLPDYLGYHLREDFESWYAKQTQTLHLENVTDITLASDGIFTFEEQDNMSIIHELCINPIGFDHKNALVSKLNRIAKKHKDDLAIVRVIL
jgi:Protein phosphatase 2C